MSEQPLLAPLVATLRDLVEWLRTSRIPGVVIGGVAASFLGRPRATRDVDAVVLVVEEEWDPFLASGARFGFRPRVADALAFARQTRVLLLRHEPAGIDVDISFAGLPFEEEMIARAQTGEISGIHVPLPTPEDLIVMKAVAHRGRDLIDVEAVLDAQGKLDLRRIRRWVKDFAATLETPELLNDLEVLLSRRRKGRRKGKSCPLPPSSDRG